MEVDIETILKALSNYQDILNPDNFEHLPLVIKRRLVMKRVHVRQADFKIRVNKGRNLINEDYEIIEEALIFIFF